MRKILLVLSVLSMLFGSGCSTLVNSDNQVAYVSTSNGDKDVEVVVTNAAGTMKMRVPGNVVIPPSTSPTVIRVDDPRYEPVTITVGRSITPSYFVNVLFFWPGLLIDPMTGAMWKNDTQVLIPLNKKSN